MEGLEIDRLVLPATLADASDETVARGRTRLQYLDDSQSAAPSFEKHLHEIAHDLGRTSSRAASERETTTRSRERAHFPKNFSRESNVRSL